MQKGNLKGILKKVLIGLLVIFVALQFIRPKPNVSAAETADDMNVLYPIPDSVHQVLKKACFDCHSNNTRYPWYSNIQPVGWWLNSHINDGKKELNFSEYGKRTLPRRSRKLAKIAKEVEEGGMPLDSYTWIHKDAVLTDREKKMIVDWANNLAARIGQDTAKTKG